MTSALSIRFAMALILLTGLDAHPEIGSSRERYPDADSVIKQIMSSALARCFSEANGIKKITFLPPTNEEIREVKTLGDDAIGPLAAYVTAEPKDGFTQLFAVRLLMALHSPNTFAPLAKGLWA